MSGSERSCLTRLVGLVPSFLPVSPLSFISPVSIGLPFEKPRVYVEIIPSKFRDIVSESFKHVPHLCRAIDDMCGYQTLDAAIVNSELIGTRLLRYVIPENLLFIFCESVESFNDFLFDFPFEDEFLDESTSFKKHGDYPNAKRSQECCADPRAVVFCKIKRSNSFEEFFGAEKKKSTEKGNRYEVTWGELQELKDTFKRVHLFHSSNSVY